MDKVQEILESVKTLSLEERRRLARELAAVDPGDADAEDRTPKSSTLDSLLRLAGTTTSEHSDLSTDKYKHVASAAKARP